MLAIPAEIEKFCRRCATAGFDLAATMSTAWCDDDPALRLPRFDGADATAVVVGNTRALWPALVAALRFEPSLLDHADVIDAYAERSIARAAAATGVRFEARWAHRGNPDFIPIQRIAARAGLAWLSPANLCVHPEFGPWIGLRAVVVFALQPPRTPPPTLADPCGACAHACLPAFAAATEDWRSWLAIRDACPRGREHRFADDQVRYHYTKDRTILEAAARAAR